MTRCDFPKASAMEIESKCSIDRNGDSLRNDIIDRAYRCDVHASMPLVSAGGGEPRNVISLQALSFQGAWTSGDGLVGAWLSSGERRDAVSGGCASASCHIAHVPTALWHAGGPRNSWSLAGAAGELSGKP